MRPKIERARAELDKATRIEADWLAKLDELRAELAAREAGAGGQVLDEQLATTGDTDAVDVDAVLERTSREVEKLRAQVGTAERAAREANGRRVDAAARARDAEAQALRAKARDLRREADDLERKTAPRLAEVAELLGVPHEPRWEFPATGGAAFQLRTIPWRLRQQADESDAEAAKLEATSSGTRRVVEGHDVDELLEKLAAFRPEAAAPPEPLVRRWADRKLAELHHDVDGAFPAHAVWFALAWRNGAIDEQHSTARIDKYLLDRAASESWRAKRDQDHADAERAKADLAAARERVGNRHA